MSMQLATRAFGVIDISEVQNKLDSIEQLESKLKAQQELIESVKDDLKLMASPSEFNCAVGEGNLRACAQRTLAKLEAK